MRAAQGACSPRRRAVLSREAILAREIDHWVNQTSTGQLFAFGVLVAMIVAAVVVYQVLSNDVREHLPEYATLKAMGYSPARLSRSSWWPVAHLHADLLRDRRDPRRSSSTGRRRSWPGIPMRLTAENLCSRSLLAIVVGFPVGLPVALPGCARPSPAELF